MRYNIDVFNLDWSNIVEEKISARHTFARVVEMEGNLISVDFPIDSKVIIYYNHMTKEPLIITVHSSEEVNLTNNLPDDWVLTSEYSDNGVFKYDLVRRCLYES